ncbi:hypothetical protein EYD45_02265 [Hyunsoonleella flava]|uniref:Lipoprotein n=1 Tax=Hyunsoonleella flava TaxID=2527939 RepID=A0A4Q9FI04_9FLAO|nr:hypothetical protein [Hyunsoonleella flava]TBN06728.1 hypothetical protein EYD45_02265 [Hyunsoonleella flava]
MKKLIYNVFLLTIFISFSACSNSDDGEEEIMDEQLNTIFSTLTIDGAGFTNLKVDLNRADVITLEDRVRLDVRNDEGYRITFTLPLPIEQKQYTMTVYNNTKDHISSMSIPDSGIFLSKAGGTLDVEQIIENGDCVTYRGKLNVEYDRQDNSPGDITVTGDFEILSGTCN